MVGRQEELEDAELNYAKFHVSEMAAVSKFKRISIFFFFLKANEIYDNYFN